MTPDEALADAFQQMLPSQLARHLLGVAVYAPPVSHRPDVAAVGERAAPGEVAASAPFAPPSEAPPEVAHAVAPPPAGSLEAAASLPKQPSDTAQLGAAQPGPLTPLLVGAAHPVVAALPAGATEPRLKRSAAPPPPPIPLRRTDEDIAELEVLEERLRALLPELAGFSRELQRLGFIAFIARARHIGFRTADPKIEGLVRRIAGRLGEYAQQFWPGSVRALQIRATPLQAGADMGLPDGGKLHDWAEAAENAERLVEEKRARLEQDRLDEYGWADLDRCRPAPNDPEARLDMVRNAMEKLFGKLEQPSPPDTDRELQQEAPKHLPELVRWARELRWLRPHVEEPLRWGQAIGRLRWAATRLPRELRGQLELVLDEAHRPQKAWASELGEDPIAKARKKLRKALLQKRQEGDKVPADVVAAWLAEAFELGDAFSTTEIAERIMDWAPTVLELPCDESTGKDRKYRRRLKLLQEEIDRRLHGVAPLPEGAESDTEAEVVSFEPDEGDLAFRRLLDKVREKIAGKSALFVSNRADPQLREKLEKELGIQIDWAEIDPRRIQARIESVRQMSYDMVLSATGFQGHSIDATLGRETKACGLPYVRVNRGRLTTCVRALARQFGLLEAAA